MAKPKQIDRNAVLDAAETVIQRDGPAALTIDAVAKQAGISKGGVQSCFGTKDGLLRAMFHRWLDEHQARQDQVAQGTDRPARIRAHIRTTVETELNDDQRSTALLAALIQNDDLRAEQRDWYRAIIAQGEAQTEGDKLLRLAFLAAEGLFYLTHLGIADLPEATRRQAGEDILALLQGTEPAR